ncbi:ABC transporter permease [Mesorhizobium australicum]|uniref:Peptide/nickel transport system permease protein n=1 Tax=Mesorhizobium australicum TaxID=536018 RepID=A0A1X7PQV0_9HYPH|nr:ABC transporter permease [Mesorhizobium australicum]SMH54234.1 peptide/nickel transport system permease protein [Mesorhizobium australicum]
MLAYIFKRVLLAIPTLLGVAVLTFFLLRVVPGDIVRVKLMSDGGAVSEETVQAERQRLGLDKPLFVQFGDWMTGFATLDFGNSMWTERPVTQEIGIRFGPTFQIAVMATLLALVIAVPLGTMSALKRGTATDYVIRLVTMTGLALPAFWVGMLLLLFLLKTFHWLPSIRYVPIYVDPFANLAQLIWPSLVVGVRFSAVLARMVRSSLLDVLGEDYIRTARAKGVRERTVVWVHALRNALLPAITVVGLEFAFLIGGLVVTEQVFNINGLGKLFIEAVTRNDFTLIQGMVMLFATIYIVVNLLVDLLYAVVDPRIRVR